MESVKGCKCLFKLCMMIRKGRRTVMVSEIVAGPLAGAMGGIL
jgi:hypothetical protein